MNSDVRKNCRLPAFLLGVSIAFFSSCHSENQEAAHSPGLLAHIAVCDSLELAGDSVLLEQEAEKLFTFSSSENIRLQVELYKIASEYNRGEYDKALKRLAGIRYHLLSHTFPEEHARALFLEARCYRKKNKFGEAIHIYKSLITLSPSAKEEKTITVIMNESLLQLMYCYIFSGRREEGVSYFRSIYDSEKLWLAVHYPRSVEVCLAYSLYEATHLEEAVEMITRALNRPEENRSDEQLFVDYGIAGAIYNQAGNIRKAIECSEKGLKIVHTLTDKSGIFYLLGNLVYQYQQVGEFEKSLATYEELLTTREIKENPYNRCVAEVNIGSLFQEWGLDKEVKRHISIARRQAGLSGEPEAELRVKNWEVNNLFLKGDYAAASALLDTVATLLPDKSQDNFYQIYYDIYRSLLKIQSGKNILSESGLLYRSLTSKPVDRTSVSMLYFLGRILSDKGYWQDAVKVCRTCEEYIGQNRLVFWQRLIYRTLADGYFRMGDYRTSSQYYRLYDQANGIFTERRNAGLMSRFRVQYETREKEQANKLLQSEVQLKERTLEYYVVVAVACVMLAIIVAFWAVLRHRAMRLRHEADSRQHELDVLLLHEQEHRLRNMLQERLELNRKNEELRNEIEKAGAGNNLDHLLSSLSPRLLTREEEQEFRQQFTRVYPAFVSRLRNGCPQITPAEELLAMLIRLNMNNEEIALALGNNRSSVITSRSRLRKKLSIDKNASLENFIRKI